MYIDRCLKIKKVNVNSITSPPHPSHPQLHHIPYKLIKKSKGLTDTSSWRKTCFESYGMGSKLLVRHFCDGHFHVFRLEKEKNNIGY